MKRMTLRQARKRAKLTQEELEQRSGVSQTAISKIETGQVANPGWSAVVDLAKALNIDPSQLKFNAQSDAVSA
jgi:transcriptional regulator with XRE-family HTH domain